MKTSWTKKELIEALKDFDDNDEILINIHDEVFYEDNYEFYLDPIHMGLDKSGKDRGHQIWLCPIQNTEQKVVSQTNPKIDNSISFKVHVKSLDGIDFINLANIQSDFPKAIMEAKRSGTGITVIVTVKEG